MSKPSPPDREREPNPFLSDARGAVQLAAAGVQGASRIVEDMHRNIAAVPNPVGNEPKGKAPGIAGLVYASVRAIAGLSGQCLDASLSLVEQNFNLDTPDGKRVKRDTYVSVLNGVVGDYLANQNSSLATDMAFWHNDMPLPRDAQGIERALPNARPRLLLTIHGLCMNERGWARDGQNQATSLGSMIGATPLYLRYNTGRHISTNGQQLAHRLEALAAAWSGELEDITILAHSMGGLVTRSAYHYGTRAGHAWPGLVRSMAFLGTPHLGAPLERLGNTLEWLLGVSPYSAPIARLATLRSAGITDLRHGSLVDEDWCNADGSPKRSATPQHLPLPEGVSCFAAAASMAQTGTVPFGKLAGDGLVTVDSALGRHPDPDHALQFPKNQTWLGTDLNHFDLLDDKALFEQLRTWLA